MHACTHASTYIQRACTFSRLSQVVAVVGHEFVSVFDGATTYTLGEWTLAKHGAASWPPLYACLYAFMLPQQVSQKQNTLALALDCI